MRLLIGLPYQSDCSAQQRDWLITVASSPPCPIHFYSVRRVPVCSARNDIIARMLRDNFTHCLMVDADVVPGDGFMDGVIEAMQAGFDVVGYPCPIVRHGEIKPVWNFGWIAGGAMVEATADNIGQLAPRYAEGKHVLMAEVDRIGTGAMLISRAAAEALKEPFRFVKWPDGTLKIGEDYQFCDRIKAAGFDVWADLKNKCSHYKGGVDLARFING